MESRFFTTLFSFTLVETKNIIFSKFYIVFLLIPTKCWPPTTDHLQVKHWLDLEDLTDKWNLEIWQFIREHQEPFLARIKTTKLSSGASCSPQETPLKTELTMFCFPVGKNQQISDRETIREVNFGHNHMG